LNKQDDESKRTDGAAVDLHFIARGARRAAEWYKAIFGAEELGNIPVPGDKYMQIHLRFGATNAMLADEFLEMGALSPQAIGGTAVVFHYTTADARTVWDQALKAGAEVVQPLKEQFWGELYGQFRDPFGHRWGIAQKLREVDPEVIARTAWQLFGGA